MGDINQRLVTLEKIERAKRPDEHYKKLYPLAPLEFTKLQAQGVDGDKLTEIWHEVINEYEQERLDELQTHLMKKALPPWRHILYQEPQLTKRALERYEQYKHEGKI